MLTVIDLAVIFRVFLYRSFVYSFIVIDKMQGVKKAEIKEIAFEMFDANLSIDLHMRSRISVDDTASVEEFGASNLTFS